MYKYGHLGLSLLLLAPIAYILRISGLNATTVIGTYVLISALSSLPDIDMKMRPLIKHRAQTHTLLAGVGFGFLLGAFFGYFCGWGIFPTMFASGFIATASHLIGDVFTPTPIMPFYPFSKRRLALGLFKSSNKAVNYGLAWLGIIALIITMQTTR